MRIIIVFAFDVAIAEPISSTDTRGTGKIRYRIAGIIRGGQFSREGEPFVLRGLFAGLKFTDPIPPLCSRADPIPPLCFAGLFFADETQP